LSTPTINPSSETKGVDADKFGSAGFSGDPPRRKIGILGILENRDRFGSY